MNLFSLRSFGMLFLVALLGGGWIWLNQQQGRLVQLQEKSEQLTQQNLILRSQLDTARERAERVSSALSAQHQEQQHLEEAYEQTRQQLRQAMAESPCADQPVPDAVIRLQRGDASRSAASGVHRAG